MESAWKVGENSRKLRETTATGFPCVELTQQEKGQAGAQDSGSPGECAQTRWASTVRPSHKLCSKPVMISTTGWEKAEKQTAAFESQAWGPSLPQFCLNPGLVSGGRISAPRLPRPPRCSIRMPWRRSELTSGFSPALSGSLC